MNIPEDVKEAINEMFLCKNLTEHMACFQHFYKELKDCTFVVFRKTKVLNCQKRYIPTMIMILR